MRHSILIGAALAALSTSAMGMVMGCPTPVRGLIPFDTAKERNRVIFAANAYLERWQVVADQPIAYRTGNITAVDIPQIQSSPFISEIRFANFTEFFPSTKSFPVIRCRYLATYSGQSGRYFTIELKAPYKMFAGPWAPRRDAMQCAGSSEVCQFELNRPD